jgi:alpha-beta hydrolase superfamily lysophospholipase/thiol-disulfide isomerase/thioredoxin
LAPFLGLPMRKLANFFRSLSLALLLSQQASFAAGLPNPTTTTTAKTTTTTNSATSSSADFSNIDANAIKTLPCRSWIDRDVKQTAVVLCIHGLGLNADCFNDFGTRMSHRGIAVYAIDVRGFGSWMKLKNGKALKFDACLDDIKTMLPNLRANHPGLPVFLLGESMGGAIVLRASSMYPELMDGLISSVPSGQRYRDGTDLKVGVKLITGARRQFDVGTSIVDQATKDERLRQIWESSPLNRMDLSAVQLVDFQAFMDGNNDAAAKVTTLPVLMLQGTRDRLVKAQGTWEIFNLLGTKNKTFIELPSEHLVIEYGRVKSNTYDSNIAQFISTWMAANATASNNQDKKSSNGSSSAPVAPSNSANNVLIFTAPWCGQCDQVDQQIAQAQKIFGDRIRYTKIDTDDAKNVALMKQHSIQAIPSFVFQKADGTTSSTLIGNSSFANFSGGIYDSLQ